MHNFRLLQKSSSVLLAGLTVLALDMENAYASEDLKAEENPITEVPQRMVSATASLTDASSPPAAPITVSDSAEGKIAASRLRSHRAPIVLPPLPQELQEQSGDSLEVRLQKQTRAAAFYYGKAAEANVEMMEQNSGLQRSLTAVTAELKATVQENKSSQTKLAETSSQLAASAAIFKENEALHAQLIALTAALGDQKAIQEALAAAQALTKAKELELEAEKKKSLSFEDQLRIREAELKDKEQALVRQAIATRNIPQLEDELKKAKQRESILNEQLIRLKESLEKLETDKQALAERLEKLQREMESLTDSARGAAKQLAASLERQIAEQTAKIQQLNAQVESLKPNAEAAGKRSSQLEQEVMKAYPYRRVVDTMYDRKITDDVASQRIAAIWIAISAKSWTNFEEPFRKRFPKAPCQLILEHATMVARYWSEEDQKHAKPGESFRSREFHWQFSDKWAAEKLQLSYGGSSLDYSIGNPSRIGVAAMARRGIAGMAASKPAY